jgi:hypothetical protein
LIGAALSSKTREAGSGCGWRLPESHALVNAFAINSMKVETSGHGKWKQLYVNINTVATRSNTEHWTKVILTEVGNNYPNYWAVNYNQTVTVNID